MLFVPVIKQADYESVRNIMGSHLPCTYDEWLNICVHWREWGGDGVRNIEVDPNEFAQFISRRRCAPDVIGLLAFAETIGRER